MPARRFSFESILDSYENDQQTPTDEEALPTYESLIHPAFRNLPEYRDEKEAPEPLRLRTEGPGFSAPCHVDLPIEFDAFRRPSIVSLRQQQQQGAQRPRSVRESYYSAAGSEDSTPILPSATLPIPPSSGLFARRNAIAPMTPIIPVAAPSYEESERQRLSLIGPQSARLPEPDEELDTFKIAVAPEPYPEHNGHEAESEYEERYRRWHSGLSGTSHSTKSSSSLSSSRTSMSIHDHQRYSPQPGSHPNSSSLHVHQPSQSRVSLDYSASQRNLRASSKAMAVLGICPPESPVEGNFPSNASNNSSNTTLNANASSREYLPRHSPSYSMNAITPPSAGFNSSNHPAKRQGNCPPSSWNPVADARQNISPVADTPASFNMHPGNLRRGNTVNYGSTGSTTSLAKSMRGNPRAGGRAGYIGSEKAMMILGITPEDGEGSPGTPGGPNSNSSKDGRPSTSSSFRADSFSGFTTQPTKFHRFSKLASKTPFRSHEA